METSAQLQAEMVRRNREKIPVSLDPKLWNFFRVDEIAEHGRRELVHTAIPYEEWQALPPRHQSLQAKLPTYEDSKLTMAATVFAKKVASGEIPVWAITNQSDDKATVTVDLVSIHWWQSQRNIERAKGYCAMCAGTGRIFAGTDPLRWAACIICKGTGTADSLSASLIEQITPTNSDMQWKACRIRKEMEDAVNSVPKLLNEVFQAARSYRKAEQDGTPRMWRGKALQDLANTLDDKITALERAQYLSSLAKVKLPTREEVARALCIAEGDDPNLWQARHQQTLALAGLFHSLDRETLRDLPAEIVAQKLMDSYGVKNPEVLPAYMPAAEAVVALIRKAFSGVEKNVDS